MKTILNFTENKTLNGYRAKINGKVVRVTTDASTVNELILSKINAEALTKQVKKGKSVKQATATLIWRATNAVIKAQREQGTEFDGIVMPNDVPKFVVRKLERKLAKRGLSLFVESDLR